MNCAAGGVFKDMKIAFTSFGCKVNQAETDKLICSLPELNSEYIKNAAQADILVVNTCAVTEKAQNDGEKYLKRLKNINPSLLIIATGCLAELLKEKLKDRGADVVIPNAEKDSIPQTIAYIIKKKQSADIAYRTVKAFSGARTRAFLKIQDGCASFCAYCIIPFLRGTPHSKDIDTVYNEMTAFVRGGYKEIVLTGVHIGIYGKDAGGDISLTTLLKRLIEIDGDYRIRLSSLDVHDITPELISLVAESGNRICPHFHISLQSGSGEILLKMGRKYAPEAFISATEAIRAAIPDACIGCDVITGFPGESEKHFEETSSLLRRTELNYLHIFPYSKRPGTSAAKITGQLPAAVKKERADRLRELGDEFRQKSAAAMTGKSVRVLSERGGKGHSDNFYMVRLPAGVAENTFFTITVTGSGEGYMLEGEI